MKTDKIELFDFKTPEQITEYWHILDQHKLTYHLDDDLDDIIWDGYPDQKLPVNIFSVLQENHDRLWKFCISQEISPWDYVVVKL